MRFRKLPRSYVTFVLAFLCAITVFVGLIFSNSVSARADEENDKVTVELTWNDHAEFVTNSNVLDDERFTKYESGDTTTYTYTYRDRTVVDVIFTKQNPDDESYTMTIKSHSNINGSLEIVVDSVEYEIQLWYLYVTYIPVDVTDPDDEIYMTEYTFKWHTDHQGGVRIHIVL